jgi:hypothetical protein
MRYAILLLLLTLTACESQSPEARAGREARYHFALQDSLAVIQNTR